MRWPVKPNPLRLPWHDWFAWHPVQTNGETTWTWLEVVQRKWYPTLGACGLWQYRTKDKS